MPSFYLDKIDGAGYIEKYNFSFMPVQDMNMIAKLKKVMKDLLF